MSEPRQAALFAAPRRPRIWRMHVADAGNGCNGDKIAEFECGRCGHRTGWIKIETVSEAKRGLPCPNCNRSTPDA